MKTGKGPGDNTRTLNEEAVRDIRAHKNCWTPGTLTALARKYNVSRTTIANVRDHKSWRHVK